MSKTDLSRRGFLGTGFALGCSAAASPLVTPVTFAAAPGDTRLVVIVLRGAMDGLDVVQPVGDRALRQHRNHLSMGESGGAVPLDNFYMMHSELKGLAPLWQAGELSFAHAVSTPYRNKRSHFDGQDLLENGGDSPEGMMTSSRDGWLNRMLTLLPGGAQAETAYAVGRNALLLLQGDAPFSHWSPDVDLDLSPQAQLLLREIYKTDPLFREAGAMALQMSADFEPADMMNPRQGTRAKPLASFTADKLRGEARIAAFSITGWDTHIQQERGLAKALQELQTAILTLKEGLGPVWDKTAVLCLTEFGRTVRENGGAGTDHGTGGAAIFAGGALKGKTVHAQWPGLDSSDLYKDRDLMPTADVRSYAAWAIRDLFGVGKADLERVVFPGVEMGRDPRLIA